MAVAENSFAISNENKLKAHYIARSGAVAVADYMIQQGEIPEGFIGSTSEVNTQIGGGEFQVSIDKDDNDDIIVSSLSEYNGAKGNVELRLQGNIIDFGGILDFAIATKNGIDISSSGGSNIYILEVIDDTDQNGNVATKNGEFELGNSTDNVTHTHMPNMSMDDVEDYDDDYYDLILDGPVTQRITINIQFFEDKNIDLGGKKEVNIKAPSIDFSSNDKGIIV